MLFASFFVHLATNLANDYFDYKAGLDSGASIGGSRVIQQGKITPEGIRNAIVGLYLAALACGLWIVVVSRVWLLLPLMLFSFLSSLFYTAPPIRYGYFGLGELFVGLNMGPVMVAGTSAALTGEFAARALWLSIPIAIMVATILYYQSLPDMDTDKAGGKRTLSVRLGPRYAPLGLTFFLDAGIMSMVGVICAGLIPWGWILAILASWVAARRIDAMVAGETDHTKLHDRGGLVRLFYLFNGGVLVAAVILRA
jgi:1,4-dihydroxy-2-naphthoate octaprenyltransferase